uniref:Uncharacterized protein n=1 Tax=Ascaris lumbricoides TaxID=6252 RepID=A0A0M3I871_ASCLU
MIELSMLYQLRVATFQIVVEDIRRWCIAGCHFNASIPFTDAFASQAYDDNEDASRVIGAVQDDGDDAPPAATSVLAERVH